MTRVPPQTTGIHGVIVVRDEWDVIIFNLLHHLRLGLDAIHIADNGSSDGTSALLEMMSRDFPIKVTSVPGEFEQKKITNQLVRDAQAAGAQWIIPIDADEFWMESGKGLRAGLEECGAEENGRRVAVATYFGPAAEGTPRLSSVLRARWMAGESLPASRENREKMCRGELPVSLIEQGVKCFFRATRGLVLEVGSHRWRGMPAETPFTKHLRILHVPSRHRAVMDRRREAGGRTMRAPGFVPGDSWHLTRMASMNDADLAREWTAASVQGGSLTCAGEKYPLPRSDVLRGLLRPLFSEAKRICRRAGVDAKLRWWEF